MGDSTERRDLARPDRRGHARQGGRRATDVPADWVSISEYARRYGVDRSTVRKWLSVPAVETPQRSLSNGILEFYRAPAVIRIRNVPPQGAPAALA